MTIKLLIHLSLFIFSIHIAHAQLPMNNIVSKREKHKMKKAAELEAKYQIERAKKVSTEASIYLDTNVLDYGDIEYGGDGFRTVIVYNRGAKPLVIYNCNTSCGCTAPSCPSESISAGDSAEITIQYKNITIPGTFDQQLTIISNDILNPKYILKIKGKVLKND